MQVQRFDRNDLRRAVRKRSCAPYVGLGVMNGAGTLFGNALIGNDAPVTAGLTHRYRDSILASDPIDGAITGSNATTGASSPAYINTGGPDFGNARMMTAAAGSAQHGVTRTTSATAGQSCEIRVWVRQHTSSTVDWCYVQSNGGAVRAWFNMATGQWGTVVGATAELKAVHTAPTDFMIWYLLRIYDFVFTAGATALYMATADNATTFDDAGRIMHFESLALRQPKVSQWNDSVGTAHLVQATPLNQPLARTLFNQSLDAPVIFASPVMQGKPAIKFRAGHSVTNATAANWSNLHDGTGGSFAVAFRVPNPLLTNTYDNIFTTNGNSATATGMSLTFRGDINRIRWEVGGAGVNKITMVKDFANAEEMARAHWVGASLATADVPNGRFWCDGAEVSSTNSVGSLTVGAPTTGLVVGGANSFDGDIAEIMVWNRHLVASEWSLVHYYFAANYGTG